MRRSTCSMFRLAVCLGLILGLGFLHTAQAADKIGEVGEKQGDAQALKSGETEETPINKGDPVELEEKISTKADAKIWLKLDDDSHNSLGEKSIVYVNDFGSEGASTYFHGHEEKGAVRYIKKLEVTDPPSSYVITTPTALIVVEPTERAADFVVRAPHEFQTEVTVIWGKVTVKNILEEITETRTIRSCQRVYVDAGKKPSRKYWVSSETLHELIELTTIPGTLPDDVPDCEPRERPCPCPWGFSMDIDGQCKPCAYYAGAMYDPELCRCVCPCPPGFFPDPITGECFPECPSDMPVAFPGIFPPDPDVLPHTGCPSCDCCPFGDFCTLSFPGDPTCPHFRCGDCGGPVGPGLPPFIVPPFPGDWYDCPKCCLCDTRFAGFGNPCGLNAAGFPSSGACGGGPRCISRNECIAQGGFFVRTEWRLPFGPCWACRPDPPKYMIKAAAGPGGQCKECKKLTFKNGKPECVPIKDGTRCYTKGNCGKCKNGKCKKLPPCPQGQIRDNKCKCVQFKPPAIPQEPEPAPEPETQCQSNSDCRKITKGQKPCCIKGECRKLKRCPDGAYRCVCKEVPVPEPEPPEIIESCDRCEVRIQGKCVSCSELNMRCSRRTGRCVPIPTPVCGSCEIKWQGRCVSCRKLGMACNKTTGQCVHKPTVCGRCQVKRHGKCLSCRQVGMVCKHGQCVPGQIVCGSCQVRRGNRCIPCEQLNMKCRRGKCVSVEVSCGSCQVKRHGKCLSCEQVGMVCRRGRCRQQMITPEAPSQPTACPACTERMRGTCIPCAQLGKQCRRGRCVYKAPPSQPPQELQQQPPGVLKMIRPGQMQIAPGQVQPGVRQFQPGNINTPPPGSEQLR